MPGSAEEQNRGLHIQRVLQPPRIEQFLSGGDVPGFARVDDFRQNHPADGKPVSRSTTAWLAYDDQNLYAVFVCTEDAGKVRARLSKRDDIFSDDVVAVYLDAFRDRRRVLGFYVNPLGVQGDAVAAEGQDEDFTYDAIWKSEGRLTPDGFVVLLSLPFRSLRFPNADVQTWGIGLARFIPARNEASYWPYYTSRVEGFAQQIGTLTGLESISPGRNLQFIPYVAFESAHYLDQPTFTPPGFRQKNEVRGGLDAKVILHDSLTLDVTLNPDFSQVESNDPQVTVNQRFEVFFPEKRPFFLENASYFQTPENLFFSRRIVNPEYGARLTGKAGNWIVGFLGIDDRNAGVDLAPGDSLLGERAHIGVARVQREFGNQSTVGAMLTDYQFGSSYERVASLDTRLKLTPNLVFSAQAARGYANNTDGSKPQGSIYYGNLLFSGLHLTWSSTYQDHSPDFQSVLSYIPRLDIRQARQAVGYKWLPAHRILKSIGPTLMLTNDWDHAGNLQDWIVNPGIEAELAGNTFLSVRRTEAVEVYRGLRFRKHSTDFSITTEAAKAISLGAGYGAGPGVNYDPATGVLPFLGAGRQFNGHLVIRPGRRFKLEEIYYFSHLSTLERGPAVFNNHLLRSQVNYQFTRELSVRAILDYTGVLPNASLVSIDRAKTVTADLLFTYLVNPGTALYAGYTNTHDNLALFPGNPAFTQRIGDPSTITGRQIFVKLSYLLRR